MAASSASALKGYVPASSFASPGAEAGQLRAPEGLVSNATTGDIYIADAGNARVDQFDSTGKFIRAWGWGVADGLEELEICTISCEQGITGSGAGQFSKPAYVAVDNSTELADPAKGDIYVADSTNNTVQRFSESGTLEAEFKGTCETAGELQPCAGSALIPFAELYGVAVDIAGNLWVYDAGGNLDEFDSVGHYLKTIVVGLPPRPGGLALDSHGMIYATGFVGPLVLRLSSETGEEFEVLSEVSQGVTAIAVAPETDNVLVDDESHFDLYGPFGEEHKGGPLQTFTSEGLADSHGLTVGKEGTAYASLRSAGRVQSFAYVPLAPIVEDESVGQLGATEATLGAKVNPRGEAASYHVDYGVTPSYGSSTPERGIGAPEEAVSVQATLTGLQPGTEYHFRVVAKTAAGTTAGEDQAFTTVASSGESTAGLPDGRVYELVSDPTLPGPGEVYVPFASFTPPPIDLAPAQQPFRAAASGEAVAYVGDPGGTGGTGQTGAGLGNEFTARRDPQAGRWDSADITPQITEGGQSAERPVYESFSEDLSIAFFGTGTTPEFSKGASPEGPSEGCGGLFTFTLSDSGYHALFGEKLGTGPGACGFPITAGSPYQAQNLLFAGANKGTAAVPANSQFLLQTPAPLTPGDHQASVGEGNNLYLSTDGHVQPVGILPGGEHDADATLGSTSGQPLAGAEHSIPGDFSNVISADGSRIFWTALEPAEEGGEAVSERLKALYVREDATSASARTLQLDASEAPAGSGVTETEEREERSGGGRFWTASTDGRKVFFSDCSRLTEDSTAQSGEGCEHQNVLTGNDLYEYDFAKPPGSRLSDLSTDANVGDSLGADVQGVIGTSEDGEYVYFVANGVLAGANAEGAKPTSGQPNLYLRHGGVTRFIASVSASDNRFELILGGAVMGDWRPNLGYRTATVSADGRHLVFPSTNRLTSFNNNGVREVYLYGAEGGLGQLICASCATGGTETSPVTEGNEPIARQGSYLYASTNPTFTPRWMNSEGSRVFFNSDEPLVPQDNNGVQDVYEWERAGHGSCTSQPGCIYLLSGATNHTRSYLIDADASGDNVFFTHRGTLGETSISSERNLVLDARVGGGFPPQSPPECTNCQATVPPPTFSHSPAETFNGPGNLTPVPPPGPTKTPAQIRAERLAKALKACRAKHNRAKRLACERQARRRFGPPHKAKTHKPKKKTGKAKKSASQGGGRR